MFLEDHQSSNFQCLHHQIFLLSLTENVMLRLSNKESIFLRAVTQEVLDHQFFVSSGKYLGEHEIENVFRIFLGCSMIVLKPNHQLSTD